MTNIQDQADSRASEKTLDRIAHLLCQSETAATAEEAQTFAAHAQKLITRHAVDEAVARARITEIETRKVPVQRAISIGKSRQRGLATYVQLFLAVARANDVQCDIAQDSTTVHAFGFGADIDMCELLYTALLVQMVEASNAYLRTRDKAEMRMAPVYRQGPLLAYTCDGARYARIIDHYEDRPVAGTTARKSFQLAFASAVGQRLREAREHAITQAKAEHAAAADQGCHAGIAEGSTSTELVLKAKEVEVTDFYQRHSKARGSWRGGRTSASAGHSSHASHAGARAGKEARLGLHREIGG